MSTRTATLFSYATLFRARTGWAHDGDEIAFLHVQVHALQRLKGGGARSERLGDPAQGYKRLTSHGSAFLVRKLSRDQLHAGLQVLAGHFRLAAVAVSNPDLDWFRSEEHTSELQSLMRISYAAFCLKKKKSQHSIYTCVQL